MLLRQVSYGGGGGPDGEGMWAYCESGELMEKDDRALAMADDEDEADKAGVIGDDNRAVVGSASTVFMTSAAGADVVAVEGVAPPRSECQTSSITSVCCMLGRATSDGLTSDSSVMLAGIQKIP